MGALWTGLLIAYVVLVCVGLQAYSNISIKLGIIMGLVKIDQSDLDTFASAIAQSASQITESANILTQYIQKLLDNQAEPLPEADETAVREALSSLSTGTATLNSLEPPTDPAATPSADIPATT